MGDRRRWSRFRPGGRRTTPKRVRLGYRRGESPAPVDPHASAQAQAMQLGTQKMQREDPQSIVRLRWTLIGIFVVIVLLIVLLALAGA